MADTLPDTVPGVPGRGPHGDIDGLAGPEVTISSGGDDRRLSTADADSALLEAAKAGAHESLEGVDLDESSLPALMTEV